MRKFFLIFILISSPVFARTVVDTPLPDGTIQRVITPDITTTIYTQDQYQNIIKNEQNIVTDKTSDLTAMQPILTQAQSISAALSAKDNQASFPVGP